MPLNASRMTQARKTCRHSCEVFWGLGWEKVLAVLILAFGGLISIYTYIFVYIHIYIYIYIHTYIHTIVTRILCINGLRFQLTMVLAI